LLNPTFITRTALLHISFNPLFPPCLIHTYLCPLADR
jgi:hypothetical protein